MDISSKLPYLFDLVFLIEDQDADQELHVSNHVFNLLCGDPQILYDDASNFDDLCSLLHTAKSITSVRFSEEASRLLQGYYLVSRKVRSNARKVVEVSERSLKVIEEGMNERFKLFSQLTRRS